GRVNGRIGLAVGILTGNAEVIRLAERIRCEGSQWRGVNIGIRQFALHIYAGRTHAIVGISEVDPAPIYFLVIPADVRLTPLSNCAEGTVPAFAEGDVRMISAASAPGKHGFLILDRGVVNPRLNGARSRSSK